MKILAISGSARAASTNTAMLSVVAEIAGLDHQITVFSGVANLPVFSPDAEAEILPQAIVSFSELILQSDALIISSPEYVRAIPGGMKIQLIGWCLETRSLES